MIIISCYHVCTHPPPYNIGSVYFQQSRIMESEDESIGLPIDPHRQIIHDLQIFVQSYQQQGFFISNLMDGNQEIYMSSNSKIYIPKFALRLDFTMTKKMMTL
jgi:hypothetical protein